MKSPTKTVFRSQSAFGQAIHIYSTPHTGTHNLLINSIISYNSIRLLATTTKDRVSMNACKHATIYWLTQSQMMYDFDFDSN